MQPPPVDLSHATFPDSISHPIPSHPMPASQLVLLPSLLVPQWTGSHHRPFFFFHLGSSCVSTWHFFKNNPQYPILRNDQSDFDDDGEDANDGGDGWDDGKYANDAKLQMIVIAMLMVMMIGREEGLDFLRDFFWQIFIMQIPDNAQLY